MHTPTGDETDPPLAHAQLKTARATAVAGIVFSVLFVVSLVLIWTSMSADPQDAEAWLASGLRSVTFAIYQIPFAGVAFLWFIGMLRTAWGPGAPLNAWFPGPRARGPRSNCSRMGSA